jgi:competence protein ComEC
VGGGAGSPALKAAFVATGTAHVMALSGWNINVIGKWINSILAFFRLQKRTRLVATTAAVIAFVIMTGAGASLVRAAVMAIFANVALASGRRSAQGRAVLYAAALMLLVSPRVFATDVGFLLSISGCLGMVYLSPFFAPFVKFVPDHYDLRGTVAGTLAATLATLPVALLAFGQFSLVALPTNVLLLPFIAPTMLVGFIGAIISAFVAPLAVFCGAVTMFFTNYDISVVKLFARIPGASVAGISFNLTAAALMVGGMAYMAIKHHDDLIQKEN